MSELCHFYPPERYFADATKGISGEAEGQDLVDLTLSAEAVGERFSAYGLYEAAPEGTDLTDAGPYRFKITDSGINRRGDRVLTAGIDLGAYKRNPVVLWAHDAWSNVPIGRAELEVVGDSIFALVTFDLGSPLGVQVAGSVKRGFLRACSVGLRILSLRQVIENEKHRGWDITESELLELSICAVGAHSKALKMSATSTPSECLSAWAKKFSWLGDPHELMSLSPAEVAYLRPGITTEQIASEILSGFSPQDHAAKVAELSVLCRQLGLDPPWGQQEAWSRFLSALGDRRDRDTARRCAIAAGLADFAGWIPGETTQNGAQASETSPTEPAPASAMTVAGATTQPVIDTQAIVLAVSQAIEKSFTAGMAHLTMANQSAVRATGTPVFN